MCWWCFLFFFITIFFWLLAALLQRGQYFQAVFLGHPDVEQRQVELILFEFLQRRRPVRNGHHHILSAAQNFGQEQPRCAVVISDKNARHRFLRDTCCRRSFRPALLGLVLGWVFAPFGLPADCNVGRNRARSSSRVS